MATTLRRFLVLLSFIFWQGGFTFYAAVVVPVGAEVLGSAAEQGWITRRVTPFLNLAGVVAITMLAWDVAASRDSSPRRRRHRWLAWAVLAALLAVLFWLHPRLDAFMDVEQMRLRDRPTFRPLHRLYLWLSTLQWAAGVAAVWLTLTAWRDEDGRDLSFRAARPEPRPPT